MATAEQEKLPTEKSFGLVFAGFFTLIGVLHMFSGGAPRFQLFIVASIFAFLAFVAPNTLKIPNRVWAKFGKVMHKITSPIILGVVFFAVITPFGLLIRIFGADLLKLKKKEASESYWRLREEGPEEKNMKLQF